MTKVSIRTKHLENGIKYVSLKFYVLNWGNCFDYIRDYASHFIYKSVRERNGMIWDLKSNKQGIITFYAENRTKIKNIIRSAIYSAKDCDC